MTSLDVPISYDREKDQVVFWFDVADVTIPREAFVAVIAQLIRTGMPSDFRGGWMTVNSITRTDGGKE